jgi:hypothetical protein
MTPHRQAGVLALASALSVASVTVPSAVQPDPFEYFHPWVVPSAQERARLERGDVVVRTLPGGNGELAVFAATRVKARPETLVAWINAIAELKRSRYVLAIRRFSEPPSVQDLGTLTLDDGDLEALRRCRPGDCALKLTADDIEAIRRTIGDAGEDWKEAVQREIRVRLLQRLGVHRAGGFEALPPYADRREAARPRDVLAAILKESPPLPRPGGSSGSFYYWSKERYGAGKNVVSMTHVEIVVGGMPPMPMVLVAGYQLFASHYIDGALGLTALVRAPASDTTYLVYVNRSRLDVLGGLFGFLKRNIVEDRIRRDAQTVVLDLRNRLESGTPPAATSR